VGRFTTTRVNSTLYVVGVRGPTHQDGNRPPVLGTRPPAGPVQWFPVHRGARRRSLHNWQKRRRPGFHCRPICAAGGRLQAKRPARMARREAAARTGGPGQRDFCSSASQGLTWPRSPRLDLAAWQCLQCHCHCVDMAKVPEPGTLKRCSTPHRTGSLYDHDRSYRTGYRTLRRTVERLAFLRFAHGGSTHR